MTVIYTYIQDMKYFSKYGVMRSIERLTITNTFR